MSSVAVDTNSREAHVWCGRESQNGKCGIRRKTVGEGAWWHAVTANAPKADKTLTF